MISWLSMRSYRTVEPVPESVQAALSTYDPLTTGILHRQGVTDAAAAEAFLNPNYDTDRHDPFLLPDMENAVARILQAISENEHIVIYSDYDCDGIPGAVVLYDFFTDIGFSNFTNYIPHRHFEGFGLNVEAVEKIAADGAKLIITVDCGSGDHAAVAVAKELGVDVIVTDHHEPSKTPLGAYALVNPKAGGSYPFQELCGAGVAFKMVEALIARGGFTLAPGREKWLLDMVGLATVSDMVPLVGENRVFAKYGLMVLRKSRRPGLQHLFRKARLNQRYVTEDDIGFTIGPRINAASRMDTPEDAFHMLADRDESDAGARVAHLEKLNNERKGLVASMTKELKKRINELIELPPVLVMGSPEWRPALAGLAANSLAETYQRPAFIWGRDGHGVIKGSCRSDGQTSVVALMNAVSEIFLEHGGHHMSGGFAVHDDHVFAFPERLNSAYALLGEQAVVNEEIVVDGELTLSAVDEKLCATLAALGPFGMGNPKPLFAFPDVVPKEVSVFGKTKEHLKLLFDVDGRSIEAIAFFSTPESFTALPEVGKQVRLIGHVEESYFMGRRQIRLRVVDIL
ncbi:MAG: single-stranded-DNA-specific exonuclease RecJ [Candidatus Paceibacterota bacterium]